jgi:hypothetical protein
MNHTERLMDTAARYIASNKQPDWVFGYAGGSVGRGDADAYSDLNLDVIIASVEPVANRIHVPYEDITIQLNIQSWEGSCTMRSKPWRIRFLSETRVVYDPHGVFAALKPAVLEYFHSEEGRSRMLTQAQEEVQHYLQCLDRCIRTDDLIGASLAVQAAWLIAAYNLAWTRHGSCSNGRLLSIIQTEEPALYEAFRTICAYENIAGIEDLLIIAMPRLPYSMLWTGLELWHALRISCPGCSARLSGLLIKPNRLLHLLFMKSVRRVK